MKSQISGKEMLVKKLWVSFLFHTLPLIQYTIFFLNSIRFVFSYLLFSSVCCTEEEMWFQLTETRNNNCQGFFSFHLRNLSVERSLIPAVTIVVQSRFSVQYKEICEILLNILLRFLFVFSFFRFYSYELTASSQER